MAYEGSPEPDNPNLIPITLFPNEGLGFGWALTDRGRESLPEGYHHAFNMVVRNGRTFAPALLGADQGAGFSTLIARCGFLVPWQTAAGVPTVLLGTDSAARTIANGTETADTDATTATYYSGCLHDNAGTALFYAGTDLATGFLNRRTQAGVWAEDGDVRAKFIVSAAGALWRTTSDYQTSVCPAGSEPFTIGNWGAAIQVGTSTARILNVGAIGARPVYFKEDGIWVYKEADARFENDYPVPISARHFAFVSPDGAGGLFTAPDDGSLIHIDQYGTITTTHPLEHTFPGRDTPRGRIVDVAIDGATIYAFMEPYWGMTQPPGMKVLKTTDNFGSFTDYSSQLVDQDWSDVATLTSLDTLANGDAILVGFDDLFYAVEWLFGTPSTTTGITVSGAISTGAGSWAAVTLRDGTAGWTRDGVMAINWSDDLSQWAVASYNGMQKYWLRLTVSAAIGTTCEPAIARLLPYRPSYRKFSGVLLVDAEASGAVPKILRGRREGDRLVWDDVRSGDSARALRLAVSSLPTPTSRKSLIRVTERSVARFPIPALDDPVMASYPGLENPTVIYFSGVDLGGGRWRLKYVRCIGGDFVEGHDSWEMAYRWDHLHEWKGYINEERVSAADALFRVSDDNGGTLLHVAVGFDWNTTDYTAPAGIHGRRVIAWVEPDDRDPWDVRAPVRTIPEGS